MPPKGPRLPEGGGYYAEYGGDIPALVTEFGMTPDEARGAINLPVRWIRRLAEDEPAEDVLRDAMAAIERYEATYPPHAMWDDQRIALGQAFIAIGDIPKAMSVLAGVQDINYMLHHVSVFMKVELLKGTTLTAQDLKGLAIAFGDAFKDAGIGVEFVGRMTVLLYGDASNATAPVWQPPQVTETNMEPASEQERYARALWADITAVVDQETLWPEGMAEDERRSFGSQFAQLQHAMLNGPKIERKTVEALKVVLRDQGEGEAWDRFRLIAAMSLYDASEPNFGRGMARAMTDPEMAAMVCHALIDTNRAREAMLVAQEISDHRVFGKILYLGEWPDDMQVPALIEDITYATVHNNKKYEPGRRIGVAEGLLELFERNRQVAEAAGEAATAAHWATQVEGMQKRLALLQSQQKSGFIRSPSARKK